jgi:hypothetical protein
VTNASSHEVTLVEATLAANCAGEAPERLIGDRAYDLYSLDEDLAERGIEMIAPHRRNRRSPRPGRPQTQTLQEALENRAPLRLAG